MEKKIEQFQKEQIEKCLFIKSKAELKISSLEDEILRLKNLIKAQKSLIKQADKDIYYYSM